GYTVTGLDLSFQMLDAAHDLFDEAHLPSRWAQADLRTLPFAPASYDLALIFIAAIQHIPKRTARQNALKEVARVLRPGGVLILALDNLAPALTCYVWWGWRKITSGGRPAVANHHAPADADAHLESRRNGASGLTWHARGLARTLRWRTWNGALDVGRSL